MADAGLDDLLIAYPLVGEGKLRRLRDLLERARVRVSLDSVEVAEGLGRVGRELGRDVEVLVEVDTGLHRLGRPPGRPTAELVGQVARVPGVEVIGLLTHAGHAYRAGAPEERRRVAEREVLDLVETAELCRRDGIAIGEISVGSTPTARTGAFVDGVTELRPGTYALNDTTMMRLGIATEATAAARVLVTVVARPADDRFVVDAGSKCFTTDNMGSVPDWLVVAGRPDLHMDFLSEEHGVGHPSRRRRRPHRRPAPGHPEPRLRLREPVRRGLRRPRRPARAAVPDRRPGQGPLTVHRRAVRTYVR